MSNRKGSDVNPSRRRFLKEAGAAAVGLSWGLPVLSAGCRAAAQESSAAPSLKQWAMVVDMKKCEREAVRRAAVEACDRAHNIPHIPDPADEVKWVWAAEYEQAFPEDVHERTPESQRRAPVLVMCNHCTNPPCVKVCPTQATWKRASDGIVMIDMHRCIGCRYCMAACPFGARSFNWRDPRPYVETDADGKYYSDYPTRTRGVVEKCDFCAERLRDGLPPACVEAASAVEGGAGALTFGDVTDPNSDVSRLLRERETIVRRPELGTGPNVYYIV
ncbi:MAG TPA: 4Fe-4S dicluster domain-containing protein [Longimicrobiales bacterium]|nr:4Fe-4S dicluster domain-containing protein [Longimicrobiales bacterium]